MHRLINALNRLVNGINRLMLVRCGTNLIVGILWLESYWPASQPGGLYRLELSRPYHRSILRMLYKTCERFCLDPGSAFTDLKGTPAYNHATKEDGLWVVPKKGKIDKVTFTIDKAVEDTLHSTKGSSEWDFS